MRDGERAGVSPTLGQMAAESTAREVNASPGISQGVRAVWKRAMAKAQLVTGPDLPAAAGDGGPDLQEGGALDAFEALFGRKVDLLSSPTIRNRLLRKEIEETQEAVYAA